jgi:hypothetical protein
MNRVEGRGAGVGVFRAVLVAAGGGGGGGGIPWVKSN